MQRPVCVHHVRRHVICEVKEVTKVDHATAVDEDNALDLTELLTLKLNPRIGEGDRDRPHRSLI